MKRPEWAYRFEGTATAALLLGAEGQRLADEVGKLFEASAAIEGGTVDYDQSIALGFAINNALAALAELSARYEEATARDESDAKEAAWQDHLAEEDLEETRRQLGPLGGGR